MKPVVLYNRSAGFVGVKVGERASIYPLNHTSDRVSNHQIATTSPIINEDNGVFETLNTIYVPLRIDTASAFKNIVKEASNAITPSRLSPLR